MNKDSNQDDSPDRLLAREVAKYYDDPLGFVMFAFDWDKDPDLQVVELQEPWASRYNSKYGPDVWFCEMCDSITAHMRKHPFDGVKAVKPFRYAVASGHGIGKSAGVGMITMWIMSTHPKCKGTATANSLQQIKTKTWSELSKWHGKCITRNWFIYRNSSSERSLYHKDEEYREKWRIDAQSSVKENSNAFAGQHNLTGTSFYIFDEASGIPQIIWETAEGGLSDGEPYIFAFGNPTQNSGYFREIWRRFRTLWKRHRVDSREVQITNKEKLDEDIQVHGIESDFVKVRILGKFPSSSSRQKIPTGLLEQAFDRETAPMPGDARVMSLDVARGGDDNCVFAFREGQHASSFKPIVLPGADYRDSMKLVARAQVEYERFKPDYFFIDSTGVGGPVADRLNQLGIPCILINFAEKSPDVHLANYRAYMADRFLQWLQAGGCLPYSEDLLIEAGAVEYLYDGKNREILIPKEQIKREIGVSTDVFDAYMLLNAMPTPPKDLHKRNNQKSHSDSQGKYDPWAGIYD